MNAIPLVDFRWLTRLNAMLSCVSAMLMDASPSIRKLIVRHIVTNGEKLADILADDNATMDFAHKYLGTSWHPCGTCRMGSPADPAAVADPRGAVIGTSNLFVADASVMPRITRTNTSLPTVMIAERISDLVQT